LEDALAVVAARGRLMGEMPPGAMLGVPLPEVDVLPLLGEELSLAAVNRPEVSVVSGPVEAIAELAARLTAQGLACRRLHTSLEDALAVVAARGRLMGEMPPGAMLGVPLPEVDVLPLLGEELSLAAVNRPEVSVVSGPVEAIAELAARLTAQGLACRRLHTSH